MKCQILHESKGRIRVHLVQKTMSFHEADVLTYYIKAVTGVMDVKVYDRTCDAVIRYTGDRRAVVQALGQFTYQDKGICALVPEHTGRAIAREFEDKMIKCVLTRIGRRFLMPLPLRTGLSIFSAIRYLCMGLRSLFAGRIDVAVLDATAIAVSVLRRDFRTAGMTMFLLKIGSILEEWTHKKSVDDLARTMSLNIDKVWLKVNGQEVLVPMDQVQLGDHIVVRTGNMIPLDGKVISGDVTINQASMTGEALAVRKEVGSYAYAGTVVEEGECIISVDKISGSGRYDRIVRMIEESEKLKSETEDRASHLADRLVPYTLGGAMLVYALTRNVTKALAVLMVDFSCALKLAMPITVLSAMRESGIHGISVKGGKFLEAISSADTIVFDKTGTLTRAMPTIAKIVTFAGSDENEMLRLAACLEEHYPHPLARAVVDEALRRELHHEERHSKVEYVVAHGISSIIDDKKVVIGSYHFIFQDEGCVIPEGEQDIFDRLPNECSHLYLAISGKLVAVICVEDPLRDEAVEVVATLHQLGISKVMMLTGDNDRTAKVVAAAVGVDEYHAEVLPEDKAKYIQIEQAQGRRVIMIGDGVNDSPALSAANVGIAISDGAAIAREIADITISADDLYSLIILKRISDGLMTRIDHNYRFIIGFNLGLLLLGATGLLQPSSSAFLHNASTLGVSLRSMTPVLK